MVHILSQQRRDEFLSANGIVRFEMCMTGDQPVPTLYIKSNVLDLHFVRRSNSLTLNIVSPSADMIIYIIGVEEGGERPYYLYSQVETLSEKFALETISNGASFDVILFNDFAIEIARTNGQYDGPSFWNRSLSEFVPSGADYKGLRAAEMSQYVAQFAENTMFSVGALTLKDFSMEVESVVYSGPDSLMRIKGFDNATVVHELLPQIIADHSFLQFLHSPSVDVSDCKTREFSDAIVAGTTSILSFQAKSFDFSPENAPACRENAVKRMTKSVEKSIRQTKGSSRMLRNARRVYSGDREIDLTAVNNIFLAIFVPALDAISSDIFQELNDLSDELYKFNHHLIVLDPMQFLRIVQASTPVSMKFNCSYETAFFYLLKQSVEQGRSSGAMTASTIYRW